MTRFKQARLPKRYQQKLRSVAPRQSLLTPLKRRPLKQLKLVECNGWCLLVTCDICAKERTVPAQSCCGVTLCLPCEVYFLSLCPVCDKDQLNEEVFCDICYQGGNIMTIRECSQGNFDDNNGCDMQVCQQCSKQDTAYDRRLHFCSMRHFSSFCDDIGFFEQS